LFVLKELRLGSDFTIDFVVPTDLASVGVGYELIEFERPDAAPFTVHGNPSARLSHAIQQIVDWKIWLSNHPDEIRQLFPAPAQYGPGYEHAFTYTIVIGTRENSRGHLQRRNALAKTTGINIRTFDSVLDQIRRAAPFGPGPLVYSAEGTDIPYELASQLRNPFYRALGDAEWRILRGKLRHHRHLVEVNAQLFAEARSLNESTMARFRDFCATQGAEEVEAALVRSRELYEEALRVPILDFEA
jgi:hypothetical protein